MRIISVDELKKLSQRASAIGNADEEAVRDILEDVRKNGDDALRAYTKKFDGAELTDLKVSGEEIEEAARIVDPLLLDTLVLARNNISAYHEKQRRHGFVLDGASGVFMGQRVLPLRRVGIYVPGGTANYPSTVLMNALPAKIAGVEEIIMVTPPKKDGKIAAPILAAAHIAGVDTIFKIGGAQAIAALAYGTESVSQVDKITGPGNIYVATAKQMVYGQCDIDMIAGPSEILVIADESANPRHVAADLISQAEHDILSACILLTTSEQLAVEVREEVARQLEKLPRQQIAAKSIENYGVIVIVDNLDDAAKLSDEIAPEHLELCVENPLALMGKTRNAGSIFLGHNTPEALGDYFAGPNHTLPTSGTARFSSGLSVDDFIKKSSFLYYSEDALISAREHVERFAIAEGLCGHARSVSIRFEQNQPEDC